MEEYRKQLKQRQMGLTSALLGSVSFYILINRFAPTSPETLANGMLHGFLSGVLIAFELLLVVRIIKTQQLLKNDDALEAHYIKQNDERRKTRMLQMKSLIFSIMLYGLLIGTIVAGFLNIIVFYTLLGVLNLMGISAIIAKIYYIKK